MIEKTEFGFTGSVTDLPAWARDNPELGMAGAMAVTYDRQLTATVARQALKGLTVSEIDTASDATLFQELDRLFRHNGGNVKVEDQEADHVMQRVILFTTVTQHVTAPDFRTAVKKALVIELMFNEAGRYLDSVQVNTWLERRNIPAYLR